MSNPKLPLWFISASCPQLVDAIPLAIHDEDGDIEDVLKTTSVADDVLDGVRYGMKSMLSPGRKSKAQELVERLAAVTVPQEKAMMARFIKKQQGRERQGFSLRSRRGVR